MLARGGQGDGYGGAFFSIGAVTKGAALSFAVTLFSAVLLGLAVSLSEWEGFSFGVQGFSYVSIALGGMLAAKKCRRFGWLHGGLVGVVYFVLSAVLFQSGFEWSQFVTSAWLVKAFWSFAAGAVGGVLGVNL